VVLDSPREKLLNPSTILFNTSCGPAHCGSGSGSLDVLPAYVAAALLVFGIPASLQQRYSGHHQERAAPRHGGLGSHRHRGRRNVQKPGRKSHAAAR
jgi:hypothetical protein